MKSKGFTLAKAILLIEGQLDISLTGIEFDGNSGRKFNVSGNYNGMVELNEKGKVIYLRPITSIELYNKIEQTTILKVS